MSVVGLAAIMALAGCSASPEDAEPAPTVTVAEPLPEPVPEPSEETGGEAPSPVATPEPLPLPEYPADLTLEDTADNALIAAEYFLELMNYIQSTGDVGPFQEVSADSCSSCADFIERQRVRYESGGFSNGQQAYLKAPQVERTSDGLAWVVTANIEVMKGIRYDGNVKEFTEVEADLLARFRIATQLFVNEWKMLALAEEAPE